MLQHLESVLMSFSPDPLSRDVVLLVVSRHVVVEDRDRGVRVVLDALQRCPRVQDEIGRRNLERGCRKFK